MKYEKVVDFLFITIGVTIPFWMLANNIAIILTLVTAIVYSATNRMSVKKWEPLYTPLILLFALMVIALLYTNNLERGFKKLEHRIVFLVIPIICYLFSGFINKKLVFKILKWYVLSILLASLIFYSTAILRTLYYASPNPFNEVNGNFFSYMELTKIIEDTHPIYFGTQVLFVLFIIGYDAIESKGILKITIAFKLMLILYLTVLLFFLNSFLLTGLFLIMIVYFGFLLKKHTKFKLFIAALLLVSISLSSLFVVDKLNGIDIKNDITSRDFSGSDFTAVRARVAKYYCSIDLISNNFWTGVSPGDEIDELMKYYEKNNFIHGKTQKFNSHNQYLTEFIYTGVFGFLVLVSLFFVIFKKGLVSHNKLLIAIGFIYLCFNLTESALVRNKGIIFFVFFTCLLVNVNFNNQKLSENAK